MKIEREIQKQRDIERKRQKERERYLPEKII